MLQSELETTRCIQMYPDVFRCHQSEDSIETKPSHSAVWGVMYEAPPRPPEVESPKSPKSPQSGAALAIGCHWMPLDAIGSVGWRLWRSVEIWIAFGKFWQGYHESFGVLICFDAFVSSAIPEFQIRFPAFEIRSKEPLHCFIVCIDILSLVPVIKRALILILSDIVCACSCQSVRNWEPKNWLSVLNAK